MIYGGVFAWQKHSQGSLLRVWEGHEREVFRLLWKISICSLLLTPWVSWKAACSIFRRVWTGLSTVCLFCICEFSILSLTPSFPFLLGWLERHPNINICRSTGKPEIDLSPPPHQSSVFPACRLSLQGLFLFLNRPSCSPNHPFYQIKNLCLLCWLLSSVPSWTLWFDPWPYPVELRQWEQLVQDGVFCVYFLFSSNEHSPILRYRAVWFNTLEV